MTPLSQSKSKLLSGAAALGIATTLALGGMSPTATPAFAEAVRVEAPQAPSFADVVEAVSPAVVSVRVKAKAQPASDRGYGLEQFGFDNLPDDHPLKRFFDRKGQGERDFGRRGERGQKGQRRGPRNFGQSQGSGFFVSEDGYIVTNNHVIDNGSEYTVVLNDGEELKATLIGTDPKTDLAVLKVASDNKFKYVNFSETRSRVGEWVVAVGNPFGLGGTVTAGIVSADARDIGSGPYDDFIQIDAAVNKGNSGGPAFNLNGEVIGVNTAIFSPSGGNVGIAFAISATSASEVVDDLIRNGSVTRGWLGVQIQPVSKDIAESIGLEEAKGALVAEAQPGSPAQKAGLKSGDVILTVNDSAVSGPRDLAKTIAALEPDEKAELEIYRDGKKQAISVTLGTLPSVQKMARSDDAPSAQSSEGVELAELGFSVEERDGSVVVSDIDQDGSAAEKGIQLGDTIVSINGKDTSNLQDVGRAIGEAMEEERKAVLFQVRSGDRNRFVAVPISQG